MTRVRRPADASSAGPGARLRALELVLTPACNLRCEYCYEGPRPRGVMSREVLRAAVQMLAGSPRREVTLGFHGGEPLLAFDLLRAAVEGAAVAAARGGPRIRCRLTTNGTLLDAERAAFLARHGIVTRLSFDGIAGAQDRRAPGTFSRLDRLLEALRLEHPVFFRDQLEVAVTVTAVNIPSLAASVAYLLGKGARLIRLSPRLTPDPHWRDDLVDELDRQLSQVREASLEHWARTGYVAVTFLQRRAAPGAPRPRYAGWVCGVGDGTSLCVDCDGTVTPCSMLAPSCQAFPPGPLAERLAPLRLGNVLDADLVRKLAGSEAAARQTGLFHRRERRHSRSGLCRLCESRWDCMVCPLSTAYVPGNRDPELVPDLPCAFNRIAARHRTLFPPQPALVDVLKGRASPLPPVGRAEPRDGAR
jgi:sulfatase maturation enzyme AslB (radical SAM superfamily)